MLEQLTHGGQVKSVMVLEMITSPIRALVVKLDINYMMCILIGDVDHADHVKCWKSGSFSDVSKGQVFLGKGIYLNSAFYSAWRWNPAETLLELL